MLLGFLRYMRGYVSFTVSGRYPERFINIAARSGVRLWDVRRTPEGFSASMYMSSYLGVLPLARRSGVRLRMSSRRGLPTVMRRYRDRVGIAVGAFVFVLAVFVMSCFIWSIDVTGLDKVSESELRSLLSSNGLYVGAFKPSLDYGSVSRSVMLEEPRVGWMAINVTGSYASVELKEEAPTPEIPDIREPCNVKARRDGVIVRINAGEGDVLLTEGSGVAEGQLVVSGVMENVDGGSRLVRAQAEVIASTFYSVSFSVPETYEADVPSGEIGERLRLSFLGLELPLGFYPPGAAESYSAERFDALSPLSVSLPAGAVTERIVTMDRKDIRLNDDSAKELLEKQSRLYELFTLSACTVDDRHLTITRSDGRYVLTADYYCTEDVARQEPIIVDRY